VKFGTKDYEYVADRLKRFREENPKSSIDTQPTYNSDGSVSFKATVIKDRSKDDSAIGTGNAFASAKDMQKPKAFEKTETVSIGRALASIGYLNDGRIATTEEMEEFYGFQLDKKQDEISKAKTVDELVALWRTLSAEAKSELTEAFSAKRKELDGGTKN